MCLFPKRADLDYYGDQFSVKCLIFDDDKILSGMVRAKYFGDEFVGWVDSSFPDGCDCSDYPQYNGVKFKNNWKYANDKT